MVKAARAKTKTIKNHSKSIAINSNILITFANLSTLLRNLKNLIQRSKKKNISKFFNIVQFLFKSC